MTVTYILIFILLSHIIIFRKMIFRWNVFGVFFITTMIFSIVGVMAFPFMKEYALMTFNTFKLEMLTQHDIVKTQIIGVSGILLVLYSYVVGMSFMYKKISVIDHFRIKEPIKNNLSNINFYFMLGSIFLFLTIYLFLKRDLLIIGITEGFINRRPEFLLTARRGMTSSYLYVVITYNLLPFLTAVSLYLSMKKKTLSSRLLFIFIFLVSFTLILLLFQKRPLIIFLISLFISGFVFRKYITDKFKRVRSAKEKKKARRRMFLAGGILFSLLLILYYSATTYQFDSIFEGIWKLTEVVLTRVFGRLSIPAFCYIHYFPNIDGHYGLTNIGLFSKIFGYELYPDSKVVFTHFSKSDKDGSMAINSIFDFYTAFGYFGLIFGNIIMGFLIAALDGFLNRLEKNNINIIFIVFCFIFAYYLSQASLARALLGYGFFFFMITWMFLQKNFKIRLRP